jgi:hypothetical protein
MEDGWFFHYSVFSHRMSGQARIQKDPCRIRTGWAKHLGPAKAPTTVPTQLESVNHLIWCAMLDPRGR